jgi:hypothetical protein
MSCTKFNYWGGGGAWYISWGLEKHGLNLNTARLLWWFIQEYGCLEGQIASENIMTFQTVF